ncbi:unnamed protein product [Ceutorhynchus assimilis]|uniref:Uncharacterized protein n=1 Tax=Ceutorhynchus assimilis TaxID=467358 RepID=A0A9N9N026_9CUCU|nr:unnamed protein product [Ceutorhynchus assimilis]
MKSQKSEASRKSKRLAEKMTAKAKSDGSLNENTVSSKGSKAKSDVYESLNADSKKKNCENRSSSNKTAASARTARSNISRRRKEAEIEAKIKKTALEQEMLKKQQEMVDLELARKLVLIEECDEKEFGDSGEDECESVVSYKANIQKWVHDGNCPWNDKETKFQDSLQVETSQIEHKHSHQIEVAEAFSYLRLTNETEELFSTYFNEGRTPSCAKLYQELTLEQSENNGNFIVTYCIERKLSVYSH